MKMQISFCLILSLGLMAPAMAQQKDSTSAKKVVEQGAKGDVILSEKIRKASLHQPPQILGDTTKKYSTEARLSKNKKDKKTTCRKKL